jgi:hypothetical protein
MSFAHYSTPAGQTGLEARLRSIMEDIRKLKVCESSTIRVEQTSRGQVLTAVGGGSGSGTGLTRFLYKSQTDEYLVCRSLTSADVEGTTDINVAKPKILRVSDWNGQTIVYTVESGGTKSVTYAKLSSFYRSSTSSGVTEYEAIRPQYVANRTVILATRPANGTGVSGVEWLQVGEGHAWAKIA